MKVTSTHQVIIAILDQIGVNDKTYKYCQNYREVCLLIMDEWTVILNIEVSPWICKNYPMIIVSNLMHGQI